MDKLKIKFETLLQNPLCLDVAIQHNILALNLKCYDNDEVDPNDHLKDVAENGIAILLKQLCRDNPDLNQDITSVEHFKYYELLEEYVEANCPIEFPKTT